ncbi:hypothetical protein ALGA_4249 [Labilibaculum antarcticum]|uniref:Peptidase M4 domain-containing protein n=2 Tax=Labilibaculum antarcticum TaxID=1717717 RepID=A0A1Y1CQJ0_9BACT|nr:hypothetical protein ALGA_4249 [Labilibaculum antarcticum]
MKCVFAKGFFIPMSIFKTLNTNDMLVKESKMKTDGQVKDPLVPEPTQQFYDELIGQRHVIQANVPLPRPNPVPNPFTVPVSFGTRMLIWKQDPSLGSIGRRIEYLPGVVLDGPRDSRIKTVLHTVTPVHRNMYGDFIFHGDTPESDCAHTFTVVWNTIKMYERALNGKRIPWAWNTDGNTDVLSLHPRAGVAANAYYSRYHKSLNFFHFIPNGEIDNIYTCRSLDIVAHETGHAILDGLKPNWISTKNIPQTGALHESFADLSAIFLALSDLDQVESFISITKANLHAKNFLAALAEELGDALGRPMGLRNADNNLRLSEVSNLVHDISQVFTGAIYDILADIFAFEYRKNINHSRPSHILLDVNEKLCKLLLKAIIKSPEKSATFTDVANNMLKISKQQGDPAIYRSFIRNRFTYREIVLSSTPLTIMTKGLVDFTNENFIDGGEDLINLKIALPNHPSITANQDRSGCCGTMQSIEFDQDIKNMEKDLIELRKKSGMLLSDELILRDELTELEREFK